MPCNPGQLRQQAECPIATTRDHRIRDQTLKKHPSGMSEISVEHSQCSVLKAEVPGPSATRR